METRHRGRPRKEKKGELIQVGFRIDRELYQEFGKLAIDRRLTRSELLGEMVRACVEMNDSLIVDEAEAIALAVAEAVATANGTELESRD